MKAREVVLSQSWGLTPKHAERITAALGITNVRFVTLGRRAARTPAIANAHRTDNRGARFLRREDGRDKHERDTSRVPEAPGG